MKGEKQDVRVRDERRKRGQEEMGNG